MGVALQFAERHHNVFKRSANAAQGVASIAAEVDMKGPIVHDELTTFQTEFGWCAMLGRGDQLRALSFAHRSAEAAIEHLGAEFVAAARRSSWNRSLSRRIAAALEGEPDEFRDIEIDLDHLTPFGRRVATFCRRNSLGANTQLWRASQNRRTAGGGTGGWLGNGANRTPMIVPCHRVIASGGRLGGFSAPQGINLKRRLLAVECAVFCST